MANYTICDTPSKLDVALAELRSATHIALDCEGRDLGQKEGKLSLISVSPIRSETENHPIFLVDAVALDDRALGPLFDLLRSEKPIKVVFDGRMDYSELAHRHNVQLKGVIDIQLADVRSRESRGEGREGQHRRLSPYIHRAQINGQPNAYANVHRLNSLSSCANEHAVQVASGEGDVSIPQRRASKPVFHGRWLERPLPDNNLEYAARDIHLLTGIYARFVEQAYINEQDLLLSSQKYVSIWSDAPPDIYDEYKSHPLLPLDISPPPPSWETLVECIGCKRRLTRQSFSKTGLRLPEKRRCWVCHALMVQRNTESQWDGDEDNYVDSDPPFY